MTKLKIKKIVAKIILVSLLFSNFQSILLEIPTIDAKYDEAYTHSLSSTNGYFTGTSNFDSFSGNYLKLNSFNFNFDFLSAIFIGAKY